MTAMRLFGKKEKKAKKESKTTRWFRVLLWKLFVRWKVRERIAAANKWASENPAKTMYATVGCLLFSLIIGAFLTLGRKPNETDNFMNGMEHVEPLFIGMQQIQDAKAYHQSIIEDMAQKGQAIKHELDSLVRIPEKTHDDSLQIVIRYKQLEMIVNKLEGQE